LESIAKRHGKVLLVKELRVLLGMLDQQLNGEAVCLFGLQPNFRSKDCKMFQVLQDLV
jgi:hypothetical protein